MAGADSELNVGLFGSTNYWLEVFDVDHEGNFRAGNCLFKNTRLDSSVAIGNLQLATSMFENEAMVDFFNWLIGSVGKDSLKPHVLIKLL